MKLTGRYASTTNKVNFEDEYAIELIADDIFEEPFEYVDITEVVYLNNIRFVIDDKVSYEDGFTVFATRYENHGTIKKELHLSTDWDAKEYIYTLTTWEL